MENIKLYQDGARLIVIFENASVDIQKMIANMLNGAIKKVPDLEPVVVEEEDLPFIDSNKMFLPDENVDIDIEDDVDIDDETIADAVEQAEAEEQCDAENGADDDAESDADTEDDVVQNDSHADSKRIEFHSGPFAGLTPVQALHTGKNAFRDLYFGYKAYTEGDDELTVALLRAIKDEGMKIVNNTGFILPTMEKNEIISFFRDYGFLFRKEINQLLQNAGYSGTFDSYLASADTAAARELCRQCLVSARNRIMA